MKIQYVTPSTETIYTLSGSPLCVSTGEGFNTDTVFSGLDGWEPL